MYLCRIIPRHLAQPVTTPYNLIEFPTRQDLLRMQTEVTTPQIYTEMTKAFWSIWKGRHGFLRKHESLS